MNDEAQTTQPQLELWVVNVVAASVLTVTGQNVSLIDATAGRLGMLPVYGSRAAALEAHPSIARLEPWEQDYYLRCVGPQEA